MHGNQWVLKIAVLKYYSVSKRGTTAKSNPKQATDPISLHTKFGDNSSNTFPLNERKPCVTPDIGRRTPDIGHRTSDGEKSKNNISTPQGGGHNNLFSGITHRRLSKLSQFIVTKHTHYTDKFAFFLNRYFNEVPFQHISGDYRFFCVNLCTL